MRTLSYYYSERIPEPEGLQQQVSEFVKDKEIGFLPILVDGNKELESRFGGILPVIIIGPYQLTYPFSEIEVEVAVLSTLDKDKHLQTGGVDSTIQPRFSKFESFSLWFANQYPWVITVFLLLYSFVPFLAPVLMKNGNTQAASAIYKVYSILCHQLAFRSYFVGGEQPFYPRELAQVKGYLTYEEVTGYSAEDILTARNFAGNSKVGYKIALCERDLAIYLSMAIVGVFFAFRGKKIVKIPWYIWFLLAVLPIAFDGVSQLPGLSENWPVWMPNRESTPLLRTITGALFGAGTAWFMYPMIEESVKDTRFQLQRKLQVVNYLDGKHNTSIRDQHE